MMTSFSLAKLAFLLLLPSLPAFFDQKHYIYSGFIRASKLGLISDCSHRKCAEEWKRCWKEDIAELPSTNGSLYKLSEQLGSGRTPTIQNVATSATDFVGQKNIIQIPPATDMYQVNMALIIHPSICKHFDNDEAICTGFIKGAVKDANLVYEFQLKIHLNAETIFDHVFSEKHLKQVTTVPPVEERAEVSCSPSGGMDRCDETASCVNDKCRAHSIEAILENLRSFSCGYQTKLQTSDVSLEALPDGYPDLYAITGRPRGYFGIVHLFHASQDEIVKSSPSVLGYATVGTLCTCDSVGMTQFQGETNIAKRTWLTFAHEVGHNFGATHLFKDNADTCTPDGNECRTEPYNKCVKSNGHACDGGKCTCQRPESQDGLMTYVTSGALDFVYRFSDLNKDEVCPVITNAIKFGFTHRTIANDWGRYQCLWPYHNSPEYDGRFSLTFDQAMILFSVMGLFLIGFIFATGAFVLLYWKSSIRADKNEKYKKTFHAPD